MTLTLLALPAGCLAGLLLKFALRLLLLVVLRGIVFLALVIVFNRLLK
jgi:hypothetical protein